MVYCIINTNNMEGGTNYVSVGFISVMTLLTFVVCSKLQKTLEADELRMYILEDSIL